MCDKCEEKKDYGKTLNLPKTDFPMRANLPEREPEIEKEVFEDDLYEKMLKKNVTVKDQFGTEYSIQATVDKNSCSTMLHSNLRYITIDGEDIRPGFEMFFQSLNSGKIFKLI